jgi:hypothetical protein
MFAASFLFAEVRSRRVLQRRSATGAETGCRSFTIPLPESWEPVAASCDLRLFAQILRVLACLFGSPTPGVGETGTFPGPSMPSKNMLKLVSVLPCRTPPICADKPPRIAILLCSIVDPRTYNCSTSIAMPRQTRAPQGPKYGLTVAVSKVLRWIPRRLCWPESRTITSPSNPSALHWSPSERCVFATGSLASRIVRAVTSSVNSLTLSSV